MGHQAARQRAFGPLRGFEVSSGYFCLHSQYPEATAWQFCTDPRSPPAMLRKLVNENRHLIAYFCQLRLLFSQLEETGIPQTSAQPRWSHPGPTPRHSIARANVNPHCQPARPRGPPGRWLVQETAGEHPDQGPATSQDSPPPCQHRPGPERDHQGPPQAPAMEPRSVEGSTRAAQFGSGTRCRPPPSAPGRSPRGRWWAERSRGSSR